MFRTNDGETAMDLARNSEIRDVLSRWGKRKKNSERSEEKILKIEKRSECDCDHFSW